METWWTGVGEDIRLVRHEFTTTPGQPRAMKETALALPIPARALHSALPELRHNELAPGLITCHDYILHKMLYATI